MPGGKDWPALSATKHTFACGVYFGLMGNSEKAHQWLDQVQKHNPQYAGIEEALKALDEGANSSPSRTKSDSRIVRPTLD